MKIIENLKLKIENSCQRQAGFSVIEVILAAALFMIMATGSITVILQGLDSNRLGKEKTVASQYASEGMEAVRSIKNQNFSALVNSAGTGIARVSNVWAFSGANNQFGPSNKYTRTIKVESVNRDAVPPAGNIVASGGTPDTDTKKITSTVSWNFTPTRVNSVQLISYLSDWKKPIVTGGPIMMAYSKTTTTPFYRTWNDSTWSAEGSATAVVGSINYVVLKSSRTRNEAILGTQTSTGAIYVQVWNGTSWGSATQVGTGPTTVRSFDISYEKSSDEAIIVYTPTSGSADFAYRIWDGSLLSSPTTITTPPTTGAINWIELRQNPGSSSNEIAMIMLDANSDVYGMVWTGSIWSNMGTAAVWDNSAATATKKTIDVEYEQTSGEAMFMWGDATTDVQSYRTWNGTTLTGPTPLTITDENGLAEWIQLAARPSSNEIMLGVQDANADLNTRKWSGSAWDAAAQHLEHDASTENIASRNFDIVWETYSANLGKAWLVWGDGATRSQQQWSGTAWGSITVASGSDDTSFVRLRADEASGAVFSGIYQCSCSAGSNRDINERHLTGGSVTWSASNQLWAGPTTADPVFFRIDFATP
ncbi:MAG: hypothetical protein AAB531_05510 [Patescibacteria group bacterium]